MEENINKLANRSAENKQDKGWSEKEVENVTNIWDKGKRPKPHLS